VTSSWPAFPGQRPPTWPEYATTARSSHWTPAASTGGTGTRPAPCTSPAQRWALRLGVREKHKWNAGHAPAAWHIPLGALSGRLAELPIGRPVMTICQSATRSVGVAALLAGMAARSTTRAAA